MSNTVTAQRDSHHVCRRHAKQIVVFGAKPHCSEDHRGARLPPVVTLLVAAVDSKVGCVGWGGGLAPLYHAASSNDLTTQALSLDLML